MNKNAFELYSRSEDDELLSFLELGNEILPKSRRKANVTSKAEVFQQR